MHVVDDLGRTLDLKRPPTRLVSLVPNLSELVYELGRGEDLVAVTEYCVEPPGGFDHAMRVRGTKNPDLAAIAKLKPDLVIANDEENRQIDVTRLTEQGMNVYVTHARTLPDVAACVEKLCTVLDAKSDGERIARAIADSAANAPVSHNPVTVFCPIWRDGAHKGVEETWWCVGPDTYAGALMTQAGLTLVSGDDDPRYPRLTLADVEKARPQLVLLPDEPYNFSADDAAVFAAWSDTTVVPYAGTDLFWWGPRTADALERLTQLV